MAIFDPGQSDVSFQSTNPFVIRELLRQSSPGSDLCPCERSAFGPKSIGNLCAEVVIGQHRAFGLIPRGAMAFRTFGWFQSIRSGNPLVRAPLTSIAQYRDWNLRHFAPSSLTA